MGPILTQRYYEAYPEVPELSGRARNSKLYSFAATRLFSVAIVWISPVSFVAITICITSWQVFIVVCKCNLWFSDHQFEETVHYIKFCFTLSKTAAEIRELHRSAVSNSALRRTRTFYCLSWLRHRETAVRLYLDRSFVTAWALFIGDLFLHCRHLTSIIDKAYATSKGVGLLETCGMMEEPGLVDSPLLYTDLTTLSKQQFLASETWSWLPILSACLIHLAACDFLFPRLKLQLWGCCFQPIPEIQEQLPTILHTIPKQSVPVVLPEMADVLDTLNKLRRELLWRRRQWSITNINVYGSPHRSWQLFFFARMWQYRKLHIHVSMPMTDTYECYNRMVGGKATTYLFIHVLIVVLWHTEWIWNKEYNTGCF